MLNITVARRSSELLRARAGARLQHVHPRPATIRARSSGSARRSRRRCARPWRASAAGTADRPVRGAAALALRADGIDYDAVPVADRGRARRQGLQEGPLDVHPLRLARARAPAARRRRGGRGADVRARAGRAARRPQRRARHQRPLDQRRRDRDRRRQAQRRSACSTATVSGSGPGARWGDVAQALAPHGLGMSSGDYGDVGVGGLATAGGIGFLARKHGLTIDHVTGAELVLADGSLVRADDGPAVGGPRRGRQLRHRHRVRARGLPGRQRRLLDAWPSTRATPTLLERWGAVIEAAPRELTSFLSLAAQQRPSCSSTRSTRATTPRPRSSALTPLLDIGPLLDQQAQLVPYPAIVAPQGGIHRGGSAWEFRSGLLDHITPEAAQAIAIARRADAADPLRRRRRQRRRPAARPPTRTGRRTSRSTPSAQPTSEPLGRDVVSAHERALPQLRQRPAPERLRRRLPGRDARAAARLKALYDPDNVFNQNFPITLPINA